MLEGYRLGIDIGHGYWLDGNYDSGAVGQKGTYEHHVVEDIAIRFARLIKQQFPGIVLIFSFDPGTIESASSMSNELYERVAEFNDENVDFVLSFHINSDDTHTATYISTWIYQEGGLAELMANYIQSSLVNDLDWEKFGLEDGGVRTANFYMVRKPDAPSVLMELGFISHKGEEIELKLPEVREKIAKAILRGFLKYHKVTEVIKEMSKYFIDVEKGHWAETSIDSLVEKKIFTVPLEKTFRPAANLTRAELAVALAKVIEFVSK